MTQRIKAADLRAILAKPKGTKRVKNAERTCVQGIWFDSKKEARRFGELSLLQKAGHIHSLTLQKKIGLEGRDNPIRTETGRQMIYKADFYYYDNRIRAWIIEDVKPGNFRTEKYLLKRAILAAMGVSIREV